MRTPTLSDVAQFAGVSYATADRVVNARGRVAEKSVRKVQDAVAALGYVRNVAAANLSRQRTYRFVFLLPSGPNAFFRRMRGILAERQSRMGQERVHIDLQEVPAFEPDALLKHLNTLDRDGLDGLAVVGLESNAVADRVSALRKDGIPVVSLVSDLPHQAQAAYIGVDNLRAGRTAARLVGIAHGGAPGKVQVILGSLHARDHRDRLAGFRDVLAQDFGHITVLPEIEGLDQADTVDPLVRARLRSQAGITAIYNLGAGNSGLRRAVEDAPHRPFCVVHELVAHSRAALEAGLFDVIIDQRPELEVDAALALMRAQSDRKPMPPLPPLLPTIYVRDNLPPADTIVSI